jgi:6-phosphofructokinase 1
MGTGAGGAGAAITEILENLLGQRLLFQPLSYLLRSGEPDGQDLLGAMNFAALTMRLLDTNKAGRLVAYRRQENYVDLPIDIVTQPGGNLNVTEFYDTAAYQARPGIIWAARV